MFKRGGAVSRSLHAPHGVKINALENNPRMRRKLSWSNPKVRNAASEGVLTHRPVVLKEGFLYKPGFLRIGGRKRRWCVLRTYSQTEASIDIYMDDTKSRFKGTISLDKDVCPMLIVKNYESKKKSPKNVFLSLKIGKRTYQFTTDSFRELKEWSSLLRQAIDSGFLFSGKITEPLNIEESMVNVKFNCNCIAIICPIRENALKTWRLNHITSFGQCGGILTFECCSTCSDPGTSRCSINIIQEKSSTVLNLMEKAIRSNPNTGEIHYERSILGDIYHCDHECGQPQRLIPAYSDPNIYRSSSTSPQKELAVPIDIHEFEVPFSTHSSGKSSDSGYPMTPYHAIHSNTPSPTPLKSPHMARHTRVSNPSPSVPMHIRSFSESAHNSAEEETMLERRMRLDTEPVLGSRFGYTDVKPRSSSPRKANPEDPIQYSTVQHDSPSRVGHKHLERVDENEGIYDTPFEPGFWGGVVGSDGNPLSPPDATNSSQRSSRSDSSTGLPVTVRVTPSLLHQGAGPGGSGGEVWERTEDPRSCKVGLHSCPQNYQVDPQNYQVDPQMVVSGRLSAGRSHRPPVREVVKLFGGGGAGGGTQQSGVQQPTAPKPRSRLHSTGDVLDCSQGFGHRNKQLHYPTTTTNTGGPGGGRSNFRGSVDNLANQSDLLSKLNEQEELLAKFLAQSRNQRNDEYGDARPGAGEDELNKPYRVFTQEETDGYGSQRSGRSSSASDRGIDRVLTKVHSDTVRGYAYKIQIPLSDAVYDVPRRTAPAPNLSNLRSDAPPKPQRYVASS